MKHAARRYVDKFEAFDFTAGKYHARKLPKLRYHQTDFLDYLAALDVLENEIPIDFDDE
jgi:hypothetical protein